MKSPTREDLEAAANAYFDGLVDYHTWRLLKGVALTTLLGVGTELTLAAKATW